MKFFKFLFKAFTLLWGFAWGVLGFILDAWAEDEATPYNPDPDHIYSQAPEHRNLVFGNIWADDD